MLNKAGAAILTSPFSSFLLSPFVYLRLISHLFIYLFFLCLPSHSSPMYVNCVMPFNSNSGLQRALNEQSTSKHAAARLFSSSRRTLRLTPSPCPPLPSLHKEAPTDSAPNTANCSRRDVNSPQPPPPPPLLPTRIKNRKKETTTSAKTSTPPRQLCQARRGGGPGRSGGGLPPALPAGSLLHRQPRSPRSRRFSPTGSARSPSRLRGDAGPGPEPVRPVGESGECRGFGRRPR